MQPTLPTPLLAGLSDMLASSTGLHYPEERWGDLERGVTAAAASIGQPDVRRYAHSLLARQITHREIELLASHLTVGETYFFREKGSFEVFERQILPALIRQRENDGRRLRIWSAGCCTGEEPYSIAILLDQVIPASTDWTITLLATDINPTFLRKAAEGVYNEWSFRTTPDWIKTKYFHPLRNHRFSLHERIRQRVAFSYLNLADDNYPSLTSNTNAMDVIFCRNVLMYFNPERARTVIDNLYRALVNGGWLIVSPAETSSELFSRFTTVEFENAILYRKDANAGAARVEIHRPAFATPAVPAFAATAAALLESATASPTQEQPTGFTDFSRGDDDGIEADASLAADAPAAPAEAQAARMARELANQGQLDDAATWCRTAIAADKLDPGHHYLLAAILQELGEDGEAAQSLTHALYLDPDFVIAHYALGNLRATQGRDSDAQRHYANALALLRAQPAGEILPESDGLTAGRLAEIIDTMQLSQPRRAVGQ